MLTPLLQDIQGTESQDSYSAILYLCHANSGSQDDDLTGIGTGSYLNDSASG